MRKFNRQSMRLKGFDYSDPGAYFVTIVTRNRQNFFGEINHEGMYLSREGQIALNCLQELELNFSEVILDEWTIMPDHIHFILMKTGDCKEFLTGGDLINQIPTLITENLIQESAESWILMKNPKLVLGKIIRYYKAKTTRIIRKSIREDFEWQRNYYEHIVRNEAALRRIRLYISNNVSKKIGDQP